MLAGLVVPVGTAVAVGTTGVTVEVASDVGVALAVAVTGVWVYVDVADATGVCVAVFVGRLVDVGVGKKVGVERAVAVA